MNTRTKTVGNFRAVYGPERNKRRPWYVKRRAFAPIDSLVGIGRGDKLQVYDGERQTMIVVDRVMRGGVSFWLDVDTYRNGPAHFKEREHAINCAYNLEHFIAICQGRVKARPTS